MTDIGIKNKLVTFVGYGHEPWLLAPQLMDTCFLYELPFLYSILKPAPLRISGDTTVCLNYAGTYTVVNHAGSSYCWNYTGATLLHNGGNTIALQWTGIGSHLITVRELDRNEVNGDLDSFWVNVVAHPVAGFGDSVLHTSVVFSDSSIGAVTWAYSFGDGFGSVAPGPAHNYSAQGSFTVRLVVGNGFCADTAYKTIVTDTCPASVSILHYISNDTVYLSALPAGCAGYAWNFGDGDTALGNNVYHVYSHPQDYLVSLWLSTANHCREYGSQIIDFETGLNETGNTELIHIYPNPADDLLHLQSEKACDVLIYDMAGRMVVEENVAAGPGRQISVGHLAPGLYLLNIKTERQNAATKLVIDR
jgi:hypothetical protein